MAEGDRSGRVAVVLPQAEAFSAGAAGAIALLAHRLATRPGRHGVVVLGRATPHPFEGVAFVPIRPRGWGRAAARYARGAARALSALRPALVEVHNRPDLASHLARRLAVPVVLVLHNDPQGMREARTRRERRGLLGRLAAVVCVSEHLRGRLLEGIAGTAEVVPNCIDLAEIPAPAAREKLILFAGRTVADKGADAFVAACALALPQLAGWRAAMIGADRFGPDSPATPFLRDLEVQAAAAGVVMHGYQPHAQVLAAMTRAAMVVVPSRWAEPFGLVALEAMASGAALLSSGRGGLAEVAGEVGVTIDPDDPHTMAAAIVALARDPGRLAAAGAAGRARAGMFDVVPAAAAWEALRDRILQSPAKRSI